MPKKKTHKKESTKSATLTQSESLKQNDKPAKEEEEYLTVLDYEERQKYDRRRIECNWAKYEPPPQEGDNFKSDEPGQSKLNDFNYLLKNTSKDCSHFEFNSEKLWKKDRPEQMPSCDLFNLDLNVLSSGLACVPFYEIIGMTEKDLYPEEKEYFDSRAADNCNAYNPIRESFLRKLRSKGNDVYQRESRENSEKPESNKINSKNNLNTNMHIHKDQKSMSKSSPSPTNLYTHDNLAEQMQRILELNSSTQNTVPNTSSVQETIFSEKESLEDWLDSVLDD